MTDRECCKFPYVPLMALVGFLTGVLVVVLRSRRFIIRQAETIPSGPEAPTAKDIPHKAILLPDTMPKGALPPPGELTIVEGIGPKVEAVLQAAGIHTLQQLARTPPSELKAILVSAGNRISNPETWPKQAKLAAAARWDELNTLQHTLKAGRQAAN